MSALALFALLHGGCDRASQGRARQEAVRGEAELGGQVVSTVDGHAITLEQVAALQRGTELTLLEALRRLQAERVLMSEAERRGFGGDDAVRHVREQATVQAFLQAEAGAVVLGEAELRKAYEAAGQRFERREARASVHVLAFAPEDASPEHDAAAKAYVQGILGELASAEDPSAFVNAHSKTKLPLFEVVAQSIPAVDQTGPLVKPYLDALFSLRQPGTVMRPIRTSFGWHAIRVTEVVPAVSVPFERARETLRGELLPKKREEHLKALMQRLRTTHGVEVAQGAAEALASLEL